MRRLPPLFIIAAAAALSACATDGAPAPGRTSLAQAADPCRADAPLHDLSDPRAEGVFGCANARNLRLMVADPRDLEHGATLPAPYGHAAVRPAALHRTREGATLPEASTGGPARNGSGGE